MDPSPSADPAAPNSEYIVEFAAGTTGAQQQDHLAAAGAADTEAVPALRMYSASLTATAVESLRANPDVIRVEADKVREVQAAPNDPSYDSQWALSKIGWDSAYGSVVPAGTSTVAVLDTGVEATDDLSGHLVAGASMLEGIDGTADPNGHGTAMASIVAAGVDNGSGIAGVGYHGVSVMPIKVLGADGTGQDSDIVRGVVYAADHGADVILMSFSNPGRSEALQSAADYAWSKGAVLVAATGNDGSTTATFPAGLAKVVGVSATDGNDSLWSGSNSGDDTFLAAPGVDISTGAGAVTGTSAAAAVVAGVAALLQANAPNAGPGVVVGRLARNADAAGSIAETGNGRVNLARALADDSADVVVPQGVAGNGGPVVGPYVAAAKNYSLTFSGSGSVAWSSTADNGNTISGTCSGSPNPCVIAVGNNATVKLTATPTTGVFAGFCSGNATCTSASMGNTDRTGTVTFPPACTTASVSTSPVAQSITYGASAAFSATATGSPAPTLQWQVSTNGGGAWTDISGATSSPLNLSQPKVFQSGNLYRAVFTNTCSSATTSSASLTVAAKSITGSFTTPSKIYDGSPSASVSTRSLSGVVGSDVVSLTGGTATFANANVGTTKTVTLTGAGLTGADAVNYVLGSVLTATANITARAITVTATADTKGYDGTTSSAGTPAVTSGSLASGDTANFSQVFTSKSVGTGKTLIPSGSVADGNSGGNYTITFVNNTAGVITARAITVTATADSKGYDGTTSSAGTPAVTSGSLASGDTANFSQVFANKSVGTGKVLNPAGSVADGNSGGNYTITFVNNTAGVITARAITVTATADSKGYDGTTSSAGTPSITSGSLASGDTANFSQVFANKNVGTGKVLIPAGSVADGNSGANYTITFVNNTAGVITARAITVTAASDTKGYDGTTSSAGTPSITSGSLASGDTANFSQVFANKNVGTGKALIPAGSVADGNSGANYTITFVNNTAGVITARAITVTADEITQVYGGAPQALTFEVSSGSLAPGDSFSGSLTRAGGTDAGTYAITQGSLTLGSNYAITYVGANYTITARAITVTADSQTKVYGQADPPLTYSVTSGTLQAGDGFTGSLTRVPGQTVAGGPYAITQGTLSAGGNYALTFVNGTLTIDKALLTLTADDKSKTYGQANPALTFSVDGLVNGDTRATALTADPSLDHRARLQRRRQLPDHPDRGHQRQLHPDPGQRHLDHRQGAVDADRR